MTIAIIDDEAINRLLIRNILNRNFIGLDIIVEEGDVDIAIEKLNLLRPNVVFLDIELKNGTGFDIVCQLDYNPIIIYTTAYSQYAIRAIKNNAFDYVLKPIDEEELTKSLIKAENKLKDLEQTDSESKAGHSNFYSFATISGKRTINLDTVFYFKSSGAYTYIFTNDSSSPILLSKNIGEIELEVKSKGFFRTHNSYIVNLKKIKQVETKREGKVQLENGEEIPVSQRKSKEFIECFETI